MSWKDRMDKYRAYLAEIWRKFLDKTGEYYRWTKKKTLEVVCTGRQYGKLLAQKTTQYAKVAARWLRDRWQDLSTNVKPLLKKLRQILGKGWKQLRVWVGVAVAALVRLWHKCRRGVAAWAQKLSRQTKAVNPKQTKQPKPQTPKQAKQPKQVIPKQAKPVAQPHPRPARVQQPEKHQTTFRQFWRFLKKFAWWVWRLRGLILALPIFWTALKLALENMARLPERVGVDIQATGEFAQTISRDMAVFGPFGITLFCLVLAAISRKPLVPLAISVFSLILPVLIWLTNYYA